MKKIVVLLHEKDTTFERTSYVMRFLIEEWKNAGHSVDVVRGIKRFVPADILVPHIDLTETPADYREFMARYPIAVNKRITDISKASFSANTLAQGDSYSGPVIVKTNRNYGGIPEKVLSKQLDASIPRRIIRKAMSVLRPAAAGHINWKSVDYMESTDYAVFPSVDAVPPAVFVNRHLVVEKFLPEMDGEDYCVRCCWFFGDRIIGVRLKSKRPIVKGGTAHLREEITPAPELAGFRRKLGIDYGKFDYSLRNGEVVLFDVSRTPSYQFPEWGVKVARHLSNEISALRGDCSPVAPAGS